MPDRIPRRLPIECAGPDALSPIDSVDISLACERRSEARDIDASRQSQLNEAQSPGPND